MTNHHAELLAERDKLAALLAVEKECSRQWAENFAAERARAERARAEALEEAARKTDDIPCGPGKPTAIRIAAAIRALKENGNVAK